MLTVTVGNYGTKAVVIIIPSLLEMLLYRDFSRIGNSWSIRRRIIIIHSIHWCCEIGFR